MIKVNDRFEFKRDQYGWTLIEWREGINPKTKEPTRTSNSSYYPRLEQVCRQIIDRSAGDAESVQGVIDRIAEAQRAVVWAITNSDGSSK